jgi:hypothetical protein
MIARNKTGRRQPCAQNSQTQAILGRIQVRNPGAYRAIPHDWAFWPVMSKPACLCRNRCGKSRRKVSPMVCAEGSMTMFEIAVFLFWLIVMVGLIAIIVISPVYTSHIAPS